MGDNRESPYTSSLQYVLDSIFSFVHTTQRICEIGGGIIPSVTVKRSGQELIQSADAAEGVSLVSSFFIVAIHSVLITVPLHRQSPSKGSRSPQLRLPTTTPLVHYSTNKHPQPHNNTWNSPSRVTWPT